MGKQFNTDKRVAMGADNVRGMRQKRGQATTGKSTVHNRVVDKRVEEGGVVKLNKQTPGYKQNQQSKKQREVNNFTKNPAKKKFWSKSIPHAAKSFTDWSGQAGVSAVEAAHEGVDQGPKHVGNYVKSIGPSLDFGLDVNDGEYIVGLDDKKTDHAAPARNLAQILEDALAVGSLSGAGFTGGAGLRAGAGLAAKKGFQRTPKPVAPVNIADEPLEHPGLAPLGPDDMDDLDIIEALGLFPGGVNRSAKGLANPNLRSPVNPINAPNKAKVHVPDKGKFPIGHAWDESGWHPMDDLVPIDEYGQYA